MLIFLLIGLIVGIIVLQFATPGSLFTTLTDLREISMQGKATPGEAASLLDRRFNENP